MATDPLIPLLFLLHHAGGSSLQSAGLFPGLRKQYTVLSLDLPGHGTRIREDLLHDIPLMARDLFGRIRTVISQHPQAPYALFGHSMGSQLAYLTALLLQDEGRPPGHVFVSSGCLPGRHHVPPGFLDLSDNELWLESARHFGGIPEEVLECEELRRYFVPLLRADLTAVVNYRPGPAQKMPALDMPVSAFYAERDLVREEDMRAWQRLCASSFTCRCFAGDHFYLFRKTGRLEECVETVLRGLRAGAGTATRRAPQAALPASNMQTAVNG